jgi:hypothetical protein
VLFTFFVAVRKPAGEGVVPIDNRVNEDVLKHMVGSITQACSINVSSIESVFV